MTHKFLSVVCGALILAVACMPGPSETAHGEGNDADDALYTLPGLDHGLIQSPVNILSTAAETGTHRVMFGDSHPRARDVVNTGHSVQLDLEPGARLTFDGADYDLSQCHFHTPSEHQIDGVTYPMEMHCVAQRPAKTAEAEPEYLVLGFLFKMGRQNAFIDEFLDKVPETFTQIDFTQDTPVFIEDLVGTFSDNAHYFTYRGSLTTPPFTEAVRWLIYQRIFEASPEQVTTINRIEGNNARHVQALYGRTVEVN